MSSPTSERSRTDRRQEEDYWALCVEHMTPQVLCHPLLYKREDASPGLGTRQSDVGRASQRTATEQMARMAEQTRGNLRNPNRRICPTSGSWPCIVKADLHHFSDASAAAYGTASYLRLVGDGYRVRCILLFSRSRIVKLKQYIIPRLELAAAALAVQQDGILRRELTITINRSFF